MWRLARERERMFISWVGVFWVERESVDREDVERGGDDDLIREVGEVGEMVVNFFFWGFFAM